MSTRKMFLIFSMLAMAAMMLFFSVSTVGCTSKPSIVGHWESSLMSNTGAEGMVDVSGDVITLDIDNDNTAELNLGGQETISGKVTILESDSSDTDDKEVFDGMYKEESFFINIGGGHLNGVLLSAPSHKEEALLMWSGDNPDYMFLLSRA